MKEKKISDEWQTPDELFEELNIEFNFDIDLCATKENSKCEDFCSNYLSNVIENRNSNCIGYFQDEIKREVSGHKINTAWMNPPYSNPKPLLEKAWEDSKHCKIVILVPNTIKTTKYMDMLDEHEGHKTFRKWRKGLEIRDLSRRTAFIHTEKQSSSPSFGCMLLVMDRRRL